MTVTFNATLNRYYGLSSDDKPTDGVRDGSSFEETDTDDTFTFQGQHVRWLKDAKPLPLEIDRALIASNAPSLTNPFATMADTGGGGGTTLLGPYTVNYNSHPNINSDIFPLPGGPVFVDGTVILDTILLVPVAWLGDTPGVSVSIEILGAGQSYGVNKILDSDKITGAYPFTEPTEVPLHKKGAFIDYTDLWAYYEAPSDDIGIGLQIYSDSGAFTAGQIKFWLVVQEPS